MIGCRSRCDEVGYRFGLAQVHFAVHECPLRVFARLRHAATLRKEQLQHAVQNVGRAVAGYFDAVFARIGVRRPKQADQHFVNRFVRRGVDNASKGQRTACFFGQCF